MLGVGVTLTELLESAGRHVVSFPRDGAAYLLLTVCLPLTTGRHVVSFPWDGASER